jgi:Cu-Zn family superoxide dismutase
MNRILVLAVAARSSRGCAQMGSGRTEPKADGEARADQGQHEPGTVTFTQRGDKVIVSATVSGLKPGGARLPRPREGRLQLGRRHEHGRALQSGRQAPRPRRRGREHHAGDMPNLRADQYGNAVENFTLSTLSVGSGATTWSARASSSTAIRRLQDAAHGQRRTASRLCRHQAS